MSSSIDHNTIEKPSALKRALTNLWVHSLNEDWVQEACQSDVKSPLSLLTVRQAISIDELKYRSEKESVETLKLVRGKNQVSEHLPVSIHTKQTSRYCNKQCNVYMHEGTYYHTPPGKTFAGSI